MKLRNAIATIGLVATVFTGCENSDNKADKSRSYVVADELYRRNQKHDSVSVKKDSSSFQVPGTVRAIADTLKDSFGDGKSRAQSRTLETTPASTEEMYTVNMHRVTNGPLGTMKGLGHNLRTLLGGKYADTMMSKYNKVLLDTLIARNPKLSGGSAQRIEMKSVPSDIQVPLIYPSLKSYFPASLQSFLTAHPEIKTQVGNDNEVVFITRNKEFLAKKDHVDTIRKHVMAYYVDGQLKATQYISAGIGKNFMEYDHRLKERRLIKAFTKEGVFYTNQFIEKPGYGNGRDSNYASMTFYTGGSKKRKQKSIPSPMPYAIPINDERSTNSGVFLHTGIADGSPRSHQCNRMPGWLAMYMYDQIGDRKVKTVVFDLYDTKK